MGLSPQRLAPSPCFRFRFWDLFELSFSSAGGWPAVLLDFLPLLRGHLLLAVLVIDVVYSIDTRSPWPSVIDFWNYFASSFAFSEPLASRSSQQTLLLVSTLDILLVLPHCLLELGMTWDAKGSCRRQAFPLLLTLASLVLLGLDLGFNSVEPVR